MAELFSRVRLEAMRRDGWTPTDVRDLIDAHEALLQRLEDAQDVQLANGEHAQTLRLVRDMCQQAEQQLHNAMTMIDLETGAPNE